MSFCKNFPFSSIKIKSILMKKAILLFLCLYFVSAAIAQTPVVKFINHDIFKNANISVLVKDLKTGENIHNYRSNFATVPASVLKVISTATALELYGPDYTFNTFIEYDGQLMTDGTLNGNLYVRGTGDPTLGSEKMGDKNFLSKWADEISQKGIKKINGNIIADMSAYDLTGVNPKWTWDDIGNYYAPGIYALSYLDNTLKVSFKTSDPGNLSVVTGTDPVIPGMVIDNQVKGTNTKSDNAYFFGSPGENARQVTGEIPANRNNFVVKADIPRPGLLLALHLKNALYLKGIQVSGFPADTLTESKATRKNIYTHTSPMLSEIIRETNVKSNNHYAEQVFRNVGLKKNKISTISNSIDEIERFWKSKGLPIDQLFMHDGSGLSPNNAVSAEFFTELMSYMYLKSKYKDQFVKSLAIAGQTGSLSNMLKNKRLDGKVFAKSGTIDQVKCYSGYILTDNKQLAFTVMVNYANAGSSQVLAKIEQFLLEITK